MSDEAACSLCGAPDDGEFVVCRFCAHPFSEEASQNAIPCPRCGIACRWGKQKCGRCQAWLVVSCVFCGAFSPYNVANCLQCGEAFAGAAQRKAAVESQRETQEAMNVVSTVGSVAAPLLGIALGAVLSRDSDD